MIYALCLFALAAVAGLYMAAKVLNGRMAPWPMSITHALLGAAGLVALLVVLVNGAGSGRLAAALAILVVAALGGFFLAAFHLRKKIAPKAVVVIHAVAAVVGVFVLITAIVGA